MKKHALILLFLYFSNSLVHTQGSTCHRDGLKCQGRCCTLEWRCLGQVFGASCDVNIGLPYDSDDYDPSEITWHCVQGNCDDIHFESGRAHCGVGAGKNKYQSAKMCRGPLKKQTSEPSSSSPIMPSGSPSKLPSISLSTIPSHSPSSFPSTMPSNEPSESPSSVPSSNPTTPEKILSTSLVLKRGMILGVLLLVLIAGWKGSSYLLNRGRRNGYDSIPIVASSEVMEAHRTITEDAELQQVRVFPSIRYRE